MLLGTVTTNKVVVLKRNVNLFLHLYSTTKEILCTFKYMYTYNTEEKKTNSQSSLNVSRHPLRLRRWRFGIFFTACKIVAFVKFVHAKLSCLSLKHEKNSTIVRT